MSKVLRFEEFCVNETLGDLMMMPVDPIPGMADVMSDVANYFSDKWNSLIEKIKSIFNSSKESLKNLWFVMCGDGKDPGLFAHNLNRISKFLFDKDSKDVELTDVNFSVVKRVFTKIKDKIKEILNDPSWSFKGDEQKLKDNPELAMKDRSLQFKTLINKVLTYYIVGKASSYLISTLTTILTPILVSFLGTLGVAISAGSMAIIIGIALSLLLVLLYFWLAKKKKSVDLKVVNDLESIPGYQKKGLMDLFRKGIGLEHFAKTKEKEYQEFTTSETPFQRKLREAFAARSKEMGEKISTEEVQFT